MVQPDDRQPADINNEIQSLQSDIDKLSKKQDISNVVQTQSWFIALGIALLGIDVALVSRGGFDAFILLSVLGLLVLGLVLVARSRKLASMVWKWELRQDGFNVNQTQRRLNVPSTLKTLATITAWVLSILGCLYLVAGFSYIVLSSFGLLALTLSATAMNMLVALGMAHLILFYIAMIIRRRVE